MELLPQIHDSIHFAMPFKSRSPYVCVFLFFKHVKRNNLNVTMIRKCIYIIPWVGPGTWPIETWMGGCLCFALFFAWHGYFVLFFNCLAQSSEPPSGAYVSACPAWYWNVNMVNENCIWANTCRLNFRVLHDEDDNMISNEIGTTFLNIV